MTRTESVAVIWSRLARANRSLHGPCGARRFLRFRLRHLLLVTLLAALTLGYLTNKYRARALVVSRLDEMGVYASREPTSIVFSRHKTINHRLIARIFGEGAVRRVEEVHLGVPEDRVLVTWSGVPAKPSSNDAEWVLSNVHRFEELDRLFVCEAELTDKALASLSKLTQLEYLHLGGSTFNERSIDCLAKLTNLKRLEFTVGTLSDGALQRLRGKMPNCVIYRSTPESDLKGEPGATPDFFAPPWNSDTTLLAPEPGVSPLRAAPLSE